MRQLAQLAQLVIGADAQLFLVGHGRGEVPGDELPEFVDAVGQGVLGPASDVLVQLGAITLGQGWRTSTVTSATSSSPVMP